MPSTPPFYDEKAGRICFRLRHDLFAHPIVDYSVVTLKYTGE